MNKTGVHGHRTRFLSIAKAPSYHSSYSPRCDQACRWWSCGTTENVPNKKRIMWTSFFHDDVTTDSSVGRAGDCRSDAKSDISRSLVQIRLGGLLLRIPYRNRNSPVWCTQEWKMTFDVILTIMMRKIWYGIHYLDVAMNRSHGA